jgi:hypothetical protein
VGMQVLVGNRISYSLYQSNIIIRIWCRTQPFVVLAPAAQRPTPIRYCAAIRSCGGQSGRTIGNRQAGDWQ